MTDKKKALIEAICDKYGFDYPENEEGYEDILNSYNFNSGCYINSEFFSLADIIDLADSIGLLDDDE